MNILGRHAMEIVVLESVTYAYGSPPIIVVMSIPPANSTDDVYGQYRHHMPTFCWFSPALCPSDPRTGTRLASWRRDKDTTEQQR